MCFYTGLSRAVVLLQSIKHKFPRISWSDLIQMAGALAVEQTGGPAIDMIYGREDASSVIPDYAEKVLL